MSIDVQWMDADPESGMRRFVRVERFSHQWRFQVRFRRREDWQRPPRVTRAMWEYLLDALERRYQRREGVKEADLVAVRAIIAGLPTVDADTTPPVD
jgi:hypothetical protein